MTYERRPIADFPGYWVDTDGVPWSRKRKGQREGEFAHEWRQLSRYRRKTGSQYVVVCMRQNGRMVQHYMHRLVLAAFVGPCPPGQEACHNDGDTANNCLENLRWDTRQNNHADKQRHGTAPIGANNSQARVTQQHIDQILSLPRSMTQKVIGAIVGLAPTTVSKIRRGAHWLQKHSTSFSATETRSK